VEQERRERNNRERFSLLNKQHLTENVFNVMALYSPIAVPMKIKGPMLDALDHILAASVGGIVTAFAGIFCSNTFQQF
jgi:hypothetical protein